MRIKTCGKPIPTCRSSLRLSLVFLIVESEVTDADDVAIAYSGPAEGAVDAEAFETALFDAPTDRNLAVALAACLYRLDRLEEAAGALSLLEEGLGGFAFTPLDLAFQAGDQT